MDKQEWWAGLTQLEQALVREAPQFCGEIWLTFGSFQVSHETYEGVEALPDPECHISWSAYAAR